MVIKMVVYIYILVTLRIIQSCNMYAKGKRLDMRLSVVLDYNSLKKLSYINYTRIPYTGQMCTIEPDFSVYTLSSTWVSDRSTNPNTSYFTAAAWTNVALKSHGSVCEENAGTTSSSKPCTKAFDGKLTTSSYWTTTAPGVGSWLKVCETQRVD